MRLVLRSKMLWSDIKHSQQNFDSLPAGSLVWVWEKFWRQNVSSRNGGSIAKISRNFFLLISCSLVRSRGSVFQNLAPLNLKEPWYLVVPASGRRSKSVWRVLYEWKSREWLNSLNKCAGACSGYIFLIRKCSEISLENLLWSISRIGSSM